MASRVKDVALVVLACAFAWSLIGLIDLEEEKRRFPRVPGGEEVGLLRRDASRLNTTLRRIAVVDSVDKLLNSTDAGLVLPADTAITPIIASAARRLVGADSVKTRVALLVLTPNFHINQNLNLHESARAEFVTDSVNGQPWCAAVHYGGSDRELGRYARFGRESERLLMLGPCAFYARYGAPGPGVNAWLRSGGAEFADAPVDYVADEVRVRRTRKIFGMRSMHYGRSLLAESCLSGRDSACSQAVMQDQKRGWWSKVEALQEAPTTFLRYHYPLEVFGKADNTMVANLEKEFGADKFEKFWRSDKPVDQAFNAAFGVSLDAWVRTWGRARYGTEPSGPRMDFATLLLSLLSVGILMGIALLIVQRRAVR